MKTRADDGSERFEVTVWCTLVPAKHHTIFIRLRPTKWVSFEKTCDLVTALAVQKLGGGATCAAAVEALKTTIANRGGGRDVLQCRCGTSVLPAGPWSCPNPRCHGAGVHVYRPPPFWERICRVGRVASRFGA